MSSKGMGWGASVPPLGVASVWECVRRSLHAGQGIRVGTGGHEALRGQRAWVRRVLDGNGSADDCLTVVGELVANVVEHGGGGEVFVWLLPSKGGVLGLLVHGLEAVVSPEFVGRLGEMAGAGSARRSMPGGEVERGRGLALAAGLCTRWGAVAPGPGHGAWCWEIREDVEGWRREVLGGLRVRYPGRMLWYGECTRRWWAVGRDKLLEADTPDGLDRALSVHYGQSGPARSQMGARSGSVTCGAPRRPRASGLSVA